MTDPSLEPGRLMGGPPSPLPVPARLVDHVVGRGTGTRLTELVEIDRLDGHPTSDHRPIGRADIAMAVSLVLFDDLLHRVPSAAAYAADARAQGRKVRLDHAAVRTLDWPSGAMPAGQESVARLLRPLGYVQNETYDLASLRMTGRSWTHLDHPESIPQWFVSELHVDRLSVDVQLAVTSLLATTADPLSWADVDRLGRLERLGGLPFEDAAKLVIGIARCFARHHPEPTDRDHDLFARESAELAWIATEGTTCNHWTDRVGDVAAAAAAERSAGRPIKDTIEVSASGRVRQTAHRAGLVERWFHTVEGDRIARMVPGSFFELIERRPRPDGSLDLAFDAANATGIFAMTRPGADLGDGGPAHDPGVAG